MAIPGIPFQNALRYTGITANALPISLFKREPGIQDVTYPLAQFVIIGKNPASGTEGELFYLSKYENGEARYLQILTGAASPGIDSITTDSGAPAVEPDGNGNIVITGGAGCTVTGTGPGNTVTIDVSGQGIQWSHVTGSTQTIVANHGYFADNASGVTFTLPATAAMGDTFTITTINAGGFTIAQGSGQSIRVGSHVTTTGVTGTLSSTLIGDSITIVCYNTNTGFISLDAPQGDLTIV